MNSESSIKIEIKKYIDGSFARIQDDIAIEKRLRIFMKGKEVLSFLCSPMMIKELVVGFAFSEGLFKGKIRLCHEDVMIEEKEDIEAHILIEDDWDEGAVAMTSGCARGTSFLSLAELPFIEDEIKVKAEIIIDLFKEFQRISTLYRLTGGVHGAALSDGKGIIVFAEDIGRHNAVDKAIGYCLLNDISTKGKLMLSSGRLSSEIVHKAVRASIPIVISRTAPTMMAIEIAVRSNLSLIGFLRGKRFNIYSYPHRII